MTRILFVAVFTTVASTCANAQTIRPASGHNNVLSPPVRQVDFNQPITATAAVPPVQVWPSQPTASHLILRPGPISGQTNPNGRHDHMASGHHDGQATHDPFANVRSANTAHPPPAARLHQRLAPGHASLPSATYRSTWKQPYSYGYFGAAGKARWSKHSGYRDRAIRWTLR